MRKLQYILLFVLFSSVVQGQVRQTAYTEIEIDRKMGSDYQVISAGNVGVLSVLHSKRFEENNRRQLVFSFFDSNLDSLWEQTYLIKNGAEVVNHHFDGEFIYIIVQEKQYEYFIMKLSLSDGIISQIAFTDIEKFTITHFKASAGTLLMGGMVNDKPAVILKKYEDSNKPIALPSVNQLKANLVDMVIDNEKNRIVVMMEKGRTVDNDALYVNWYDLDGNILLNREVRLSREFNLLTYKPLIKENGELMVFGTFGLKNEQLAQGVYSMTIQDGKLQENRFYDFGYLKNFFNYYPENKRDKKVRKIKRKLEEDNRMRFSYKTFVHELFVQEDRIIFSAEVYEAQSDFGRNQDVAGLNPYNPYYNPSLRRQWMGFGYYSYLPSAFAVDPWWNNRPMPTDFDYTHAFALGFDKNGKLLWDNSYVYDDTESNFPIELVQVASKGDTTAFFEYKRENYYFKSIYKSEFKEENVEKESPLANEGDLVDKLEHGGVIRWFGNNFLVSGLKDIRNKQNNELKRDVFFISKFTFNPAWNDDEEPEDEEADKKPK